MLGVLGAIAFGIVAFGAWASDDAAEKRRRQSSRQDGCSIYIDKKGRVRNTSNGRLYDWDSWRERESRHRYMRRYNIYYRTHSRNGIEPELTFGEWFLREYDECGWKLWWEKYFGDKYLDFKGIFEEVE